MNVTVRWVAPTHYTDGAPIAEGTPIRYDLYQIAPTAQPVITGIVGTSQAVRLRYRHTCFYVRAVVHGVPSAGSNLACA